MTTTKKSSDKNSNDQKKTEIMQAGDLSRNLMYHLWETYSSFLRFMDARSDTPIHKLSLTQWRTLHLIYNNPGCSQSALAKRIGITRASMSPVINFLEKKGLIERKPAERRNTFALSMTATGKTGVQSLYQEIELMEKEIGDSIGVDRLTESVDLLAELRAAFDAGSEDNE